MGTMVQTPDVHDPLLDFSDPLLPMNGHDVSSMQRSAFEALTGSSLDFIEQANSVLKSSSHGYKDRDVPPRVINNNNNHNTRPRERRPELPGYERKRPRFSLKPAASQSTVVEDAPLNLELLSDPADFFRAIENKQLADEEYRRLTGQVSTQLTFSKRERKRRPEVPGYQRKSSHKQLFETLLKSQQLDDFQELLPEVSKSQKLDSSQELLFEEGSIFKSTSTHKNGALQEQERADPAVEKNNKRDSLLEQLLSQDCTDLDGDGVVEFLQKQLELHPINLDRLQQPEIKSLRKTEDKAALEQFPKSVKVLPDIQNVTKRIIGKGSAGKHHVAVDFTYSPDSPTPPRSSFSSVPMSSSYVLEADRPGNLFSFPGIDDILPVNDSIPVADSDKDGGPAHVDSTYHKADVTEPSSPDYFVSKAKEKLPSASSVLSDNMMTENSAQMVNHMEDGPSKFVDNVNAMQQFEVLDTMENNLHELQNQVDRRSDKPDNGLEDIVSTVEDPHVVSSEGVEIRYKGPTRENQRTSASQVDISCPIDEDHPEDGNSENAVTPSEVHNKLPKELNLRSKQKVLPIRSECTTESPKKKRVTGDSPNVRRKQKPPLYLRERDISRRKSLTGAGTLWKQGVRRSTRMKMKPLEYWRGERLLYARVHESLVTVVGCKCISPTKSSESPKLKVRSFVSDAYKDIVDKVADMQGKRVLSLKRR